MNENVSAFFLEKHRLKSVLEMVGNIYNIYRFDKNGKNKKNHNKGLTNRIRFCYNKSRKKRNPCADMLKRCFFKGYGVLKTWGGAENDRSYSFF